MEFNNFRYSKKHDSYRSIINVYNFNLDEIEVYLRADYKVVVSDNKLEDIVDVPYRVKLESIHCHYVDDNKTLLMIELKLKDLDVSVNWK